MTRRLCVDRIDWLDSDHRNGLIRRHLIRRPTRTLTARILGESGKLVSPGAQQTCPGHGVAPRGRSSLAHHFHERAFDSRDDHGTKAWIWSAG